MARGSQGPYSSEEPKAGPPQHVLREGVWSGGEGPGPLVAILWFPFWHLLLSVLRALLTRPTLVAFAVKTGGEHAYVCRGGGKERRGTGRLPTVLAWDTWSGEGRGT